MCSLAKGREPAVVQVDLSAGHTACPGSLIATLKKVPDNTSVNRQAQRVMTGGGIALAVASRSEPTSL